MLHKMPFDKLVGAMLGGSLAMTVVLLAGAIFDEPLPVLQIILCTLGLYLGYNRGL